MIETHQLLRAWVVAVCAFVFVMFGAVKKRIDYAPGTPDLRVEETSGNLRITWARELNQENASIEIVDGGEVKSISIGRDMTSATYRPATSDVQIFLCSQKTRFLGLPAHAGLGEQANSLAAEATADQHHIDSLEKTITQLNERPAVRVVTQTR